MFKNKLANIDEEVTVVCAVVMKKKWDIILLVVGFSTQHHRIVTNYVLMFECKYSGVARGVAGVAEATPIIQFLFNKFGQKIRVKKIVFTEGYTNFKILPTSLRINADM